jgi:hypothetical protein
VERKTKTLNRKSKLDRRWEALSLHQKTTERPQNHQKATLRTLGDKTWPTHAGPRSDLLGACRPCSKRGESARPWLEAAGLEEAGDPRGEARALKKYAKVSISDSKEKTQNK